jgi:hypothetical protein
MVARGPVTAVGPVLVVTLDSGHVRSVFDEEVVAGHEGPVLVIIPKWETGFNDDRLGWVRKAGVRRAPVEVWLDLRGEESGEEEETDGLPEIRGKSGKAGRDRVAKLKEAIEEARRLQDDPTRMSLAHAPGEARHAIFVRRADGGANRLADTGVIDRLQTFRHAPGWTPMIVDEAGRPILIAAQDDPYFVLSEPDLMNTHGLASLDNARAMTAMLDQMFGANAAYVFDVSMHGLKRSRSFLRQAFEPPFLAATLCALATALLMGWHAFVRFGRARREGREFALGKRALADNQADLIKMTRREHRMGEPYGTVVRDLAARAVGAPRDLSPEALDALLDRLGEGGRTSWPLSALRRDLAQAKDAGELERAAAKLHHWRLEMTRERQ